ncbi:hypothetical protein [Reichenbachiella ulvae]|uniref:Uncharacterized protein n=1 Tax=Reichenbachiella ulvae TaxID=2980104 RepID=A0ABT3CT74_9BACT|nr:hypothetical protein [Reichenbachiella ulvae]MCV9386443.1 hypothetical protein [Reichenbachiella ulvae]
MLARIALTSKHCLFLLALNKSSPNSLGELPNCIGQQMDSFGAILLVEKRLGDN